MKAELAALITEALEKLVIEGVLEAIPDAPPQIDRPKDTSHGDLSCNIAMVLAKRAGLPPAISPPASSMRYPTTRSSIPATSLDPAFSIFSSTPVTTLR